MFYRLEEYPAPLKDYGIDIPLSRDRYEAIIELITKNDWPLTSICRGQCDLSFLDKNFIDQINKDPISIILMAYELVDSEGRYQRYHPHMAKRALSDILGHHMHHAYVTQVASEFALANKRLFSYVIGGGMHHAHQKGPGGFCIINDVALSALHLAQANPSKNFWIIDVDAHRGDGTAAMTENHPQIKTLSIHMQHRWPMTENKIQRPWHFIPSTCDIGLKQNEEHLYLEKLQNGLDYLAQNYTLPDLVFIVQGSDAYYLDELASTSDIKLNDAQILARDQYIFDFFYRKKIPQVYTMGGGYGASAHKPYLQFLDWLKTHEAKVIYEV